MRLLLKVSGANTYKVECSYVVLSAFFLSEKQNTRTETTQKQKQHL